MQPSEIEHLKLEALNVLLEESGSETITLADTAALHRFLMNAGAGGSGGEDG